MVTKEWNLASVLSRCLHTGVMSRGRPSVKQRSWLAWMWLASSMTSLLVRCDIAVISSSYNSHSFILIRLQSQWSMLRQGNLRQGRIICSRTTLSFLFLLYSPLILSSPSVRRWPSMILALTLHRFPLLRYLKLEIPYMWRVSRALLLFRYLFLLFLFKTCPNTFFFLRFVVLVTSTEVNLGGLQFDLRLASHLARQFDSQLLKATNTKGSIYDSNKALLRLRYAVKEAHTLNKLISVFLALPGERRSSQRKPWAVQHL